jgi:type VI secretion system protein
LRSKLIGESLFEKISGHFLDGSAVQGIGKSELHIKSISDHLYRLLNTRKDTLIHKPDYGMPDMADLYRKLPASAPQIEEELADLIEKYEPRIERPKVKMKPFNALNFRLEIEVTGYLRNGHRIQLETFFTQNGAAKIPG